MSVAIVVAPRSRDVMQNRIRTLVGVAFLFQWFSGMLISDDQVNFATAAKSFFAANCLECHDSETQEGGVSFEDLSEVNAENSGLWKQIWEQVALNEMPPRDEVSRPDAMARYEFSHLITDALVDALKDVGGFKIHLHPSKGNHLDHALLFDREYSNGQLEPPSSPARIWRIQPQEHLTRLNALINLEPDYNARKPGLRTRGDRILPNPQGEVKVYFGLDRVIGWVGGSAAYAAAITGFPPVLSTEDTHGLRNYADQYSVNGSEAIQIAGLAEDILKFMAYGPEAEEYQFADRVSEIDAKYKHGDLRGLSQSLFYSKEIKRPLTPVYELVQDESFSDDSKTAAIIYLFEALTGRQPRPDELKQYVSILDRAVNDLGKEEGVILGLAPIFLDREAVFRVELVDYGTPDRFGRIMLQDEELGLAVNAALSYLPPDGVLKDSIAQGRMKTKKDVAREVSRILADPSIRKPRVLQFFREFFDYDRAGSICKDTPALTAAGGDSKGTNHYTTMHGMASHTDRLVEMVLAEDKDVLAELLTTNRVVISPGTDVRYFSQLEKLVKKLPKVPKGTRITDADRGYVELPKGKSIHVRVPQVVKRDRAQRSLTELPADQRRGILTHPSWLVSHSDAMDNHAILRGRWVRERLLGDSIPDVPITVDAMLPDEPKVTLRHRMRVTQEAECYRCHRKMDPLGLPFEMFSHAGLYRTTEKGKKVNTEGAIIDSGDAELDGPVENALEMIDRLAASDRVHQVFVRHAFRFWMGRNETLNDAPVLREAYRAYQDNGGSMNALLKSLLTSDAFLYRKVLEPESRE
ncbi:MAG: DUF1588 domain-containing protein [Planctomycetaceae bacterium]|nr:DUF1588 domain-containing protein [Planctomycetaceae bacterium]